MARSPRAISRRSEDSRDIVTRPTSVCAFLFLFCPTDPSRPDQKYMAILDDDDGMLSS